MAESIPGRIWRWAPGAAVLAFALSLALFGGPGYTAPTNVHEAIYEWASEHPGENVPLIVQTTGDLASANRTVSALGGEVKQDLGSISAIQADVPVDAVRQLAASHGVSFVSLDAPMTSTGFIDPGQIASAYQFAVNAPSVWNAATPRTGQGVGIAVLDTGVTFASNTDFLDSSGAPRVNVNLSINAAATDTTDGYGHGTHVSGIIGGDGDQLSGRYVGIAPQATLLNIKIADDQGRASLSDVISGVLWAVENKDAYNIRVLNLSLHSSVAQSYKTDPLDAAVEFAWARGIVVVVAAGNAGTAPDSVSYAPSNDPFVITVGAMDDMGTQTRSDDVIADFSSRGVTQDGFKKPEVVAPGRRIVSDIDPASVLARLYPDRFTDGVYFRLSGTSMSAPMVTGIAALMLEQNPALTPGHVKYILMNTGDQLFGVENSTYVRADTAVFFNGTTLDATATLSPGRKVQMAFTAKVAAVAYVYGSLDQAGTAAAIGLNTDKVAPLGTTLDAIKWDAIKWDAIKWDVIKWDVIKWDVIKWDVIKWDVIKWDVIKWDVIKWGVIKWDAIKWDVIKWDVIKWDAIKWDAMTSYDATMTAVGFDSAGQFDSVSGN